MQTLGAQELTFISGGATRYEIIDTGAIYGGAIGVVAGIYYSSTVHPFDPRLFMMSCVGGASIGTALGAALAMPFAALFGESNGGGNPLHLLKKLL